MRPTRRAVALFAAGLPVSLLAVLASGRLWTVWLAYVGVLVVLLGADAVLAPGRRRLRVEVEPPSVLFIGGADPLLVRVRGPAGRAFPVEVLCDLDDDLERQPILGARVNGEAELRVPLVPRRRGTVAIERVWLRWTGPLGLAQLVRTEAPAARIPVLPNTRAVRGAAVEFFSRNALHGLKIDRLLGDGSQFEALREHMPGMDLRAIDWKHSARHRRLVSKEFRAERNHQIVLAYDTGHLMSEPMAGIPKLDHAINAGLLLAYVSMRGGDRVGFFGFDAAARTYADPVGGVLGFQRLQQLSAELDYAPTETNFTLGLAELATRLRRRSMLVVMTDFVDTVTAELMVENLHRLARKHLIVFVTLRDPELDGIAQARPGRLRDVYRSVVAADFLHEREVVLEKLRRIGVHALDVAPQHLSTALLNRYLEVKRRELI